MDYAQSSQNSTPDADLALAPLSVGLSIGFYIIIFIYIKLNKYHQTNFLRLNYLKYFNNSLKPPQTIYTNDWKSVLTPRVNYFRIVPNFKVSFSDHTVKIASDKATRNGNSNRSSVKNGTGKSTKIV